MSTGRSRSLAPSTSAGISSSPLRRRASAALSTSSPISDTWPISAMKPIAALTDSARAGDEQREGAAGQRERNREQDRQRAAPRIHRRIQQAEHDQHRQRHDDLQARDRALLVLELAAPDEVMALGRLHALSTAAIASFDHRSHVAALDVELQREVAAVAFPVDRRHAAAELQCREIAQRHARAGLGGHRDGADLVDVVAHLQRQHQPHRHRALAFPHGGRHAPGQRGFQRALRVLDRRCRRAPAPAGRSAPAAAAWWRRGTGRDRRCRAPS